LHHLESVHNGRPSRFGWPWVEGRVDDPWDREAEAPPLAYGGPAARPSNILSVDEVELERWGKATTAPLATQERSEQAGFHWVLVPALEQDLLSA